VLSKLIVGTWTEEDMSLYLDRCQIDTPDRLVRATWKHVSERRSEVGRVVDFGAGDGRFARHGVYRDYRGYEIDRVRLLDVSLPTNAELIHRCAFSQPIIDADVCIGNPPFVRNQNLPSGWRSEVAEQLSHRSGVTISGLANAWQYFFLLSLVSAQGDGLIALVIPYEWVSRPSTRILRDYIVKQRWEVDVYRLVDASFASVLTTASITIVDKATSTGKWRYFEETADGRFHRQASASGAREGHLPYTRQSATPETLRAVRGLSPGTQKVLTLTEAERSRQGLRIDDDVVPCVTSLRYLPPDAKILDSAAFWHRYRAGGARCWLIRTDIPPSRRLAAYLQSIPESAYQTSTCLARETWWKFKMPDAPEMLVATSFKGSFPKIVANPIAARAVGGVAGLYGAPAYFTGDLAERLRHLDIRDRIVAHANGLRKVEINQLNALLHSLKRSQP
jgi:hypothetical protein